MCTYLTLTTDMAGSARGGADWFGLGRAVVYFDHPQDVALEHALCIDFRAADGDPAVAGSRSSSTAPRRVVLARDDPRRARLARGPGAGACGVTLTARRRLDPPSGSVWCMCASMPLCLRACVRLPRSSGCVIVIPVVGARGAAATRWRDRRASSRVDEPACHPQRRLLGRRRRRCVR